MSEWWEPVRTDSAYCARLRADYPSHAHLSNEQLVRMFASGRKYATNWDSLDDAYNEYEELADAYLALRAALAKANGEGSR